MNKNQNLGGWYSTFSRGEIPNNLRIPQYAGTGVKYVVLHVRRHVQQLHDQITPAVEFAGKRVAAEAKRFARYTVREYYVPNSPLNLMVAGATIVVCCKAIRFVARLSKFIVKSVFLDTFTVVSLATGHAPKSNNELRGKMYRAYQPVEATFMLWPFEIIDRLLYGVEHVALGICVYGGVLHCVGFVLRTSPRSIWTVITPFLRGATYFDTLAAIIHHPRSFLLELPTLIFATRVYGWWFRKPSQQVHVSTVVNNYLGGEKKKKVEIIDPLFYVALGLDYFELRVHSYRALCKIERFLHDPVGSCTFTVPTLREIADWVQDTFTVDAAISGASYTLKQTLRVATIPLRFSLAMMAGDYAAFVPGRTMPGPLPDSLSMGSSSAVHPPTRTEPSLSRSMAPTSVSMEGPTEVDDLPDVPLPTPPDQSNALAEVITIPHSLVRAFTNMPILAASGQFRGIRRIGQVRDPKFLQRLQMRPLTNNRVFEDFLLQINSPYIQVLNDLTKVAPTPVGGMTELLKFSVKETAAFERDEIEYILYFLDAVLHISGHTEAMVHPREIRIEDFSSKSRRAHPGWTMRAAGYENKERAFPQAQPIAVSLYDSVRNGESTLADVHRWLALPVVKKSARRRPKELVRPRLAVIPEMWHNMLMMSAKHLVEYVERQNPKICAMSKFEFFYGKLSTYWDKFYRPESDAIFYEAIDCSDHGASANWPILEIVAQWLGRHLIFTDGQTSSTLFWRTILHEMCFATIASRETDEGNAAYMALFETSAGIKDGLQYTSFIDGLCSLIIVAHRNFQSAKFRLVDQDEFPLPAMHTYQTMEVHGDNNLMRYPAAWDQYSVQTPPGKKFFIETGFKPKDDECALSHRLTDMEIMSWRMSYISSSGVRRIVGWKSIVSCLKSLFFCETTFDFSSLKVANAEYLFGLITCNYILHYWNIESRMFLEAFWNYQKQIFADYVDDMVVMPTSGRMNEKFAMMGVDLADITTPVAPGTSEYPFPREEIVRLWLYPKGPLPAEANLRQWVGCFAAHGPTMVQAQETVKMYNRMRESEIEPYVRRNVIADRAERAEKDNRQSRPSREFVLAAQGQRIISVPGGVEKRGASVMPGRGATTFATEKEASSITRIARVDPKEGTMQEAAELQHAKNEGIPLPQSGEPKLLIKTVNPRMTTHGSRWAEKSQPPTKIQKRAPKRATETVEATAAERSAEEHDEKEQALKARHATPPPLPPRPTPETETHPKEKEEEKTPPPAPLFPEVRLDRNKPPGTIPLFRETRSPSPPAARQVTGTLTELLASLPETLQSLASNATPEAVARVTEEVSDDEIRSAYQRIQIPQPVSEWQEDARRSPLSNLMAGIRRSATTQTEELICEVIRMRLERLESEVEQQTTSTRSETSTQAATRQTTGSFLTDIFFWNIVLVPIVEELLKRAIPGVRHILPWFECSARCFLAYMQGTLTPLRILWHLSTVVMHYASARLPFWKGLLLHVGFNVALYTAQGWLFRSVAREVASHQATLWMHDPLIERPGSAALWDYAETFEGAENAPLRESLQNFAAHWLSLPDGLAAELRRGQLSAAAGFDISDIQYETFIQMVEEAGMEGAQAWLELMKRQLQ